MESLSFAFQLVFLFEANLLHLFFFFQLNSIYKTLIQVSVLKDLLESQNSRNCNEINKNISKQNPDLRSKERFRSNTKADLGFRPQVSTKGSTRNLEVCSKSLLVSRFNSYFSILYIKPFISSILQHLTKSYDS